MFDTIFAMLFLPKPPADRLTNRCEPQFEKHWSNRPASLGDDDFLPQSHHIDLRHLAIESIV
jgi:hypothetical protein